MSRMMGVMLLTVAAVCCLSSSADAWIHVHRPAPHMDKFHESRSQSQQDYQGPKQDLEWPYRHRPFSKYHSWLDHAFDTPSYYNLGNFHDVFGTDDPFLNMDFNPFGCLGKSREIQRENEPRDPQRGLTERVNQWEKNKIAEWEKKQEDEKALWEKARREERRDFMEQLRQEREKLLKQHQRKEMAAAGKEHENHKSNNNVGGQEGHTEFRDNHKHPAQNQKTQKNSREYVSSSLSRSTEIATILVNQYSPDELKVTSKGREVTVQGRHKCLCDEGCLVTQFERTYQLPKSFDSRTIQATLGKDGTLRITGQKRPINKQEHISDMSEQNIQVESSNPPRSGSQNTQCPQTLKKSGINLAKKNARTGEVFLEKNLKDIGNEAQHHGINKIHSVDDEDVTIEVVQYDS